MCIDVRYLPINDPDGLIAPGRVFYWPPTNRIYITCREPTTAAKMVSRALVELGIPQLSENHPMCRCGEPVLLPPVGRPHLRLIQGGKVAVAALLGALLGLAKRFPTLPAIAAGGAVATVTTLGMQVAVMKHPLQDAIPDQPAATQAALPDPSPTHSSTPTPTPTVSPTMPGVTPPGMPAATVAAKPGLGLASPRIARPPWPTPRTLPAPPGIPPPWMTQPPPPPPAAVLPALPAVEPPAAVAPPPLNPLPKAPDPKAPIPKLNPPMGAPGNLLGGMGG